MENFNKKDEMRAMSELLTDMAMNHADKEEIQHVIEYTKDVIDSDRSNVNVKQSAKDHDISNLKEKYQM